jgi:predicted SnoaL-like aldol condensation-catalyzing enzyme
VGATRRRSATSREREYIQHNRNVEDGKAGLKNLIARPPKDTKIESVRLLTDGDYVVAHGEFFLPGPKVAFDVFRFEKGKIAERWDNIQVSRAKRERRDAARPIGAA